MSEENNFIGNYTEFSLNRSYGSKPKHHSGEDGGNYQVRYGDLGSVGQDKLERTERISPFKRVVQNTRIFNGILRLNLSVYRCLFSAR